ncbi:Serine/threonine-protein phosphatase 7 long form-like [Vitis vinifera]|uniref:Serine/threonine-protein phosphatase 7 long form-like n=1 Tax=Vitis vinifera TaxID=29760 RepID=A0A438HIJ8_VITVI|nr:Serine/threonine-protein phosphatase 7 long form-like [Vitis vinifera]
MTDSTVEVLCYWNGTILRTETDLRYIGNNVEIEPIDVPIHTTFVELLKMIYDIIGVDRDDQLVLKCRHPTEMNKFQPLVVRNDRTVARMLLVPSKYGMSSVQLFIEQTPNHYHLSNEMGHLTRLSTENIDLVMVQQVVECENTRFVNLEVGDRSNNPEVEFEVENTSLVASPHGRNDRYNWCNSSCCCGTIWLPNFLSKAMKAKRKAMTRLFGDWYKSYAELPRFFLALEQSNPGCIMYSKTVPGNNPNEEIFQRVFWAFAPSIIGFAHCRPVLSIDGTHLYGKYKGTLLIAMGCDGNNQLFPLAFAITKGENTDSWSWFLACIRVGVTQRKGLCLISDRHPGIIAAVNETYSGWTQPDACHRFCMRHLASNFNTKFKDKTLKDLMCRAAMESKGARTLPITALVQLTFYRVNSYFTVRREHGASRLASGEEFTPHIDAKIKAKVVKAGAHEVRLYDHVAGRFHVKTRHSVGSSNRKPRTYHVTLQTGSCTYMDTPLFRARPDPEDTSVLTLQHRHRSSTIRVDPDMGSVLSCRHRMLREWVDWPLITALVERWRPETHTFHMSVGEMTITLQDVAILFGLRVHGHPVTGSTDIDWHALCEELLGVRPAETDIRGASLTVRFITTHFSRLPPGVVDEVTLQRHARAYLLLLYSWGSATLAHLYRELCRASLDSAESIAGPLHLLQLWSWERLHVGRPSRSLPHAPVPIDERFPPDALGSRWRVPLSHTDTPHHVLVTYRDEFDRQRSDQFGLIQGIPSTPPIDSDLHSIDRRGRPQFDWRLYHEHYVALWEARGDHIVTAAPIGPHMDYHAPYMTWYRRITRRFITPMSDFGPMRYQATALSAHLLIETMTSIISRGGHALEDSDIDACRTEHGGDRSPAQSTVARPPLVRVQSPISSDVPSVQHPTSSDPPSAQPLTSSDPPSVQPPTSLDLPPSQPPTSSDPPLVQIDTSTQLDLPPVIPRGRRGLRRPRLLPPPPPLFPALAPSQTNVLHGVTCSTCYS